MDVCKRQDPRYISLNVFCENEIHDFVFERHRENFYEMSRIFTFAEVLAVVLSDVIFFLQESNQKYVFYSQDNKVA